MEANLGTAEAHPREFQENSEETVESVEPIGVNVQQTTSFLLDELNELEDANNLIEEMLRDEELEETPDIGKGSIPNTSLTSKFPTQVTFSSPEKKVIVQYIENPEAECILENLTSIKEDVAKNLAIVNGYNAQDDSKYLPPIVSDVKENVLNGNQNVAPELSVEPVAEVKEPLIIDSSLSSKDETSENLKAPMDDDMPVEEVEDSFDINSIPSSKENLKAPTDEMPDHEKAVCEDFSLNIPTDTDRITASPPPILKVAEEMSDPIRPTASSNNSAHSDGRKLSVCLTRLKIPPEAEISGNLVSVSLLEKYQPHIFNKPMEIVDMSDPPPKLKSRICQSFQDEEDPQRKSPLQALNEELYDSQRKSENKSPEIDLPFLFDKKSSSTRGKPSEDMFSSDEDVDSHELKRMKQNIMKSSLFNEKLLPSLDPEVCKKYAIRQCRVILKRVEDTGYKLDLSKGKRSRSISLASSASSPVRFVSRTPSNSSRSPSVSRKRKRILSGSSRSSRSRSPRPKSRKSTFKDLDSDSEAEKVPKPDTLKNDANKPQENLSESKPKLPKYSDSSRPNDKHMKYEDYKKHHDSHKSSKSKDKKRKRDREHDKHRSDQKVEGKTIDSEKKFFQKDLLKKSPQLKNFLDAIQIEIGRGNLDFLKPMMNKHSLVDLAKFEEIIMKAVKVIERTGQFYGGGVDSRPKVAPVPKDVLEKLEWRICTVVMIDCKNQPENKETFERARQNYSLDSSRRKAVLSEGLKAFKKLISTPTEFKTSKKSPDEKIDKVGKSFKIPKKNDVIHKDAKKPDHERKPHRSDSYNFIYKKNQSTSNKRSFEDDLCSKSFDFGSVVHDMQKMMKGDNLKKRESEKQNRKSKEDPDLEKALSTRIVDKKGFEINAFTTWFEGNKRIFKCWVCSLSVDGKDIFLKHLATEKHLSNFKSFSSPCSVTTRTLSPTPYSFSSKSLKNPSELQESRNASNKNTFETSLSYKKDMRTLPEPQRHAQRAENKMSTVSDFRRKSPSPEPEEFVAFDDSDYEDDEENELQLPFFLGLLLPEPKPLLRPPICDPKPPDSPNNEALMLPPPIESNKVSDLSTTSQTNSPPCESVSPVAKLSAKDLSKLPPPMSSIDRVENYRKEQSPPPEISSSPYSPGGSMTPPSPGVSNKKSGKDWKESSSSTKTLNDSGFRINPNDSFVGIIKPTKVQENSEKNNSVKPSKATIKVKSLPELVEGKEKKKSDATLVETLLTTLRVALETSISQDSLERPTSPEDTFPKNEESLANPDMLRAKEKLSGLTTSQGRENVSQDDYSSFVNKYRQVMAPFPGAPPLPVEQEKLSSALAKVRAKKAAQMSVLAKEAPDIPPRQGDSIPAFPFDPQILPSNSLPSQIPPVPSQFPYAPPKQPQPFHFNETHQRRENTKPVALLPVPCPFNPITIHPSAQRGPFLSFESDGLMVSPMGFNAASSLQPGSQRANFQTLPPSNSINSLTGEAKHSWETNPVSVGQKTVIGGIVPDNGEDLNHFYVMEVYREWGFVHDFGGWDGIILDYSKRCEEANGGPDSIGHIFQNPKYNDKIRSLDGQVSPAYSYNSSTQMFACNICNVSVNGKINFDNHLSGKKHVARELSQKDSIVITTEGYIPPSPLIQPLLNKFDKSPLIGIEYLVEVLHPPLKPSYRCLLCTSVLESTDVVPHMADVKHKLAYLKAFFPKIFNKFNEFPDLSVWRKSTFDMLTSVIRTIESQYGRLTPLVARSLENFESNKTIMLEAINAGPHLRPLPDLDLSFVQDPFAAYRSFLLPEYLFAGNPGFTRR